MARWNRNLIWVFFCLLATVVLFSIGFAKEPASSRQGQSLLSIGKIGADPIKLKIWTQREAGATFHSGEPIVLNFETDRKAYVMALNVSPSGDVMILFPNGESPDNLILPGKTYTLFGSDSSIQLTANPRIKQARIIFFASAIPFNLDPLTVPAGRAVIKIPHSDPEKLNALTKKLEDLAQKKGFNRQVVLLKSVGQSDISVELMGEPQPPKSVKPGSVIGGQGVRPGSEKPGKE